jgi:hypothetical protein
MPDNGRLDPGGTMNAEQRTFVGDELFQLTLSAVTQRGAVYVPNLSEIARRPLHETLREELDNLLPAYLVAEVPEAAHLANLETLRRNVTRKRKSILQGGNFRIGSAQKALNLHLKYYWCIGEAKRPPHCPFDYYVLREIPGWKTHKWTAIGGIDEYKSLVDAARSVAGSQALADWELALYNKAGARLAGTSPSSGDTQP